MPQQRKIIHVDCDCFFAAIEMRDNPELANKPIAVGGRPDQRGVVATCNYAARAFGVHSAMPAARARSLCPELIFLPPRMEAYREASRQITQIFADYSELIEPLSLDEAFIDVSECKRYQGSATRIAEEIRQRVKSKVGITVSAGVAPNKFIAKVASDWQKPDGLTVIRPDELNSFVEKLPVKRLHGVGQVTERKLKKLGIQTCADLLPFSKVDLSQYFGGFGARLYELARGIDERAVKSDRRRKSLSVEHTFAEDLPGLREVQEALEPLLESLLKRLGPKLNEGYALQKCVVKLKFDDFIQTTVDEVLASPDPAQLNLERYSRLIASAWQREARPVRLIGLGVGLKDLRAQSHAEQLTLFKP